MMALAGVLRQANLHLVPESHEKEDASPVQEILYVLLARILAWNMAAVLGGLIFSSNGYFYFFGQF